jgi:hypothetical protein
VQKLALASNRLFNRLQLRKCLKNKKTALMFYRQFFVYVPTIQIIFSVSYLGILKFLSVIEIYNKMSEIQNFWLLALTDASISDIHTCVKVYTSCQYGA